MRRLTFWLAMIAGCGAVPAAQACKIIYRADPAADFIRDAGVGGANIHVIFSGEIVSVSEYRAADGSLVRDMAVRPERWWRGERRGLVLVRSVTPTGPFPCSPPPPLIAKEGEQWLIFGWLRDGRVQPYADPRVSMPLAQVPPALSKALERIGRAGPPK
jgi:hypothetical protein